MLKIIIAILIFSAIVLFHELGHFLLAKKNGICVEEFALGLGPTIWGFTKGETRYSIKCLPLGGCCMMLGEDSADDDPRAFGNKSPLARFSVVFAGPFFNFILAFILALIVVGFSGATPSVVGEVEPGSAAVECGISEGDRIVSMDGSKVYLFREISLYNALHTEKPEVEVTFIHDGVEKTVTAVRKSEDGYYRIGIKSKEPERVGFFGTLKYSVLEVRYQIRSTFMSLAYLFSGKASLRDLSGPVGIVNMIGETYESSIAYGVSAAILSILSFAILLSANLGVMNLLPLPALDGGRLVFIIIEMIRGKRMDPDKEGRIHFIGLVLLLALMVLICFSDIRNIFFR